ncbi:hypothetical protein P3T37_000398 [Kitasatospora sp. MAA4]|uniref:hypothetical protein n=1 Tax=Kitasatospora sp. MAA4 TaxID=3035093 RepID=UPI002476D9A4|nr:hypothetical protein [Kitasatospora sp. MAA4]MDH6131031.1 hypothetical protein [Kitasatospora sp. MAA4]
MSTTTMASLELVELGKFFTVAARRFDAGQAAPEMFSTAIDAAWHRLAEDREAHSEFSQEHAGQELIHAETAGHGTIAWVNAYEEAYGPLPLIWFTNAHGTVNSESLARYRETGVVVAEWDCSPKPGPGDGDDMVPKKTAR